MRGYVLRYLALFVCGLLVAACCSSAEAAVLAYWDFEDGSGGTASDVSGNLWHGDLTDFIDTTANAGQYEGDSGWAGGALNFDGRSLDNTWTGPAGDIPTNDTVRTQLPLSAMQNTSFTIEAVLSHNWPQQEWSPFFGQSTGSIFYFGKRGYTEQLHFNLGGLGGGDSDPLIATPVSDGEAHHIALVFDDNADTIDIFFDHVNVGGVTGVTGVLDAEEGKTLWLGGVAHNDYERWNGFAYDVRVTVDDLAGDGTGVLGPEAGFLPVPGPGKGVATAIAPPIAYDDFADAAPADFRFRGTAGPIDDKLRLTSVTGGGQGGSATLSEPVALADDLSFAAEFTVNMSDGVVDQDGEGPGLPGADGMLFVLHQDPRGALALGGSGGNMGIDGGPGEKIERALSIELDTWSGGSNDPNTPIYNDTHIGINVSTATTSLTRSAHDAIVELNDGADKDVWVNYDGVTREMEVRIANAGDPMPVDPTIRKNVDLSKLFSDGPVYLGFTAGTGGALENHDVVGLSFDSQPSGSDPVPFTPTSFAYADFSDVSTLTLNNSGPNLPASVDGRLRLTDNFNDEAVAAWRTEPIMLAEDNSFTTEFAFEVSLPSGGDPAGADGMNFVVHTGADGADSVGWGGGALGLDNIGNYLAVDFDTWNGGVGDVDGMTKLHLGISTSSHGNLAWIPLMDEPYFNDGGIHNALIRYDGTEVDVFLWLEGDPMPGTPTLSAEVDLGPVFGYSNEVYAGFTAATGGANNRHEILSWEFATPIPEPSTLMLAAMAALGLIGYAWRRRK